MTRFKDGSKIGQGGFCEVWRCIRVADDSTYAKKVLIQDDDVDNIKRFRREVRILSSLNHPNVVKIIDKALGDKPLYYVMPLYKDSLRSIMISVIGNPTRIRSIYSSILAGVEYAHSQGVLHRDLKPENVLLNHDDDVVVSDFGLGREIDAESTRVTKAGVAMGTQWYMAPEQFTDAKNADERADVYALGRMLYELYTEPLLSGVQDLSRLPTGIDYIVSQCTRQKREDRLQSISDLRAAWEALHDASLRKTERDELKELAARLTSPDAGDDALYARIITLLTRFQSDTDLLHECLMAIHHTVLLRLYGRSPDIMSVLLRTFLIDVQGQSWGFTYTDKIADKCQGIFLSLGDSDLRARILVSLMIIGVDHNRFHVLEVFAGLIEGSLEVGDEAALKARLEETADDVRRAAAEWLDLSKIASSLRTLFPRESESAG